MMRVETVSVESIAIADHAAPGILVIPISMDGNIRLTVEGTHLDAPGLIEKLGKDTRLVDTVRQALSQASHRAGLTNLISMRLETLSAREKEILIHLANGNSNKSIARELGISARTVEVHRSHVMTKMHARSFADLIRMAVTVDLVDQDSGQLT